MTTPTKKNKAGIREPLRPSKRPSEQPDVAKKKQALLEDFDYEEAIDDAQVDETAAYELFEGPNITPLSRPPMIAKPAPPKKQRQTQVPPPSRPRVVSRYAGDSDSDSDTERQMRKKRQQQQQQQQQLRGENTTVAPPMSNKLSALITAAIPNTAAAAKSKGKSGKAKDSTGEQHRALYKTNITSKADETKVIKVPDFLNQGELTVDLLEDIEKLYGVGAWDDSKEEELPLFQIDLEEKTRAELTHKGVFYNPRVFSLIQQMLTRNPESKLTTQQLQNEVANLFNIEPVTRHYEESMLYSPVGSERACVNGSGCLAYEWWGFVMKEFITPLELSKIKTTRTRDNVVKMCLVCVRKSVDMMQTSCIIGGLRNPENYCHQFHRNEVNKKGEYTFEYSIPLGHGIMYPIIMNNKMAYTYHTNGNLHWVTQDGYRQCTQEDIEQQNFHNGTPPQKNHESGSHPSRLLAAPIK